jgi:DedD protein
MAFFKFRLPNAGNGDDGSLSGAPGESLEALRRRARQRLIGATILVLLAVIGFPMLFDTQPRPVAVDIPIDIPDKQKTPAQSAPAALAAATATGAVSPQASLSQHEEVVPTVAATAATVASGVESSNVKPAGEDKASIPVPAKTADKPATEAVAPRFVVQVGAYADEGKARDVRQRVEKAGLKTYTHVAETKEGKRTRVRVGPFASKDEADKAVAKLKAMNLQATVLTL